MAKLIISKKANSSSKVMGILGALLLIIGVYMAFTAKPPFAASDFEEAITYLAPAAIIISGVLVISISIRANKGYISVYDDHIEGYGLTGSGTNGADFYFKKEDGYVASVDRSALIINCKGVSYKIILGSDSAREVYRYIIGQRENNTTKKTAITKKETASETVEKEASPAKKAPAQKEISATPKEKSEVAQPNETTICVCPHCGTKCRVLSGKGKIMIKCPKCLEKFIENT